MSENGTSSASVRRSLFSDDEQALLTRLAAQKGLLLKEIIDLIELERGMEHMGKRWGIHLQIENAIERIAERRLQGQSK